MTQRDRVLELLRAAGDTGVHTFELRAKYIGNPSQRIAELEAAGHTITRVRERLHGQAVGTRYRLVMGDGSHGQAGTDAGRTPVVGASGPGEPVALFDPPPPRPAGAYEEAA